jgi:pimeloyl-ACP methyl ester carboxylesterase
MIDRFAEVNGIRLHYLDYQGEEPALVLLPGLTANAHSFDGLVKAGLNRKYRVLALDLRGRGLSDKPESGYAVGDHAEDVVTLLDALGIERAVICGHSYGGVVTMYLAARHPGRVEKVVLIDSAAGLINAETRALIQPSLARLGKSVPSWDEYLVTIKQAPFFVDWWDPMIESYFRADVEDLEDGSVMPRAHPEHINQVMEMAEREPWAELVRSIRQPLLILRAVEPFGANGAPPLLSETAARSTIDAVARGYYAEIPGNHMTMLFGAGADRVVSEVVNFIEKD